MRIGDGCDPNAHKLMKRSNHDFSQPTSLGHVIEAKSYRLNRSQRVIQSQGGNTATPKICLSYVPPQPMRISGWRKDKQAFMQYITAEEVDDNEGENAKTNPETTVFDRLQPSTSCQCPSVFRRIGKGIIPKPSIFRRLKKDEQPKSSIFARIKIGETSSSAPPSQKRDSMFSRLGKTNEVQSSIPSRMKRVSTLDVRLDGSLKVKRCVLILTGHGAKANSKERTNRDEQTSCNCDASQEVDVLPWRNAGLAPGQEPKLFTTIKRGLIRFWTRV